MTCIVGIVDGGRVVMGADSAGCSGWAMEIRKDPKLFRVGAFVIGYTSSFRMGQLLRFKFHPADHPATMDCEEYMATLFVDGIRDVFKAGGFAAKEKEQESGGCFLVGYRDRLFKIESDYQVGETLAGFDAVGCGAQLALGAMDATISATISTEERINAALRAAENWSNGVRGPFIIVNGEDAAK